MHSPPEDDLYTQAVAHLHKGQYEQAVALFTEIIRATPDWAEAYVGRGLAYRSLEQDAKAESDEQKAQELYRLQAEAGFPSGPTPEQRPPVTVASLLTALRQYRLLLPPQLDELGNERFADAWSLAEALQQKSWLTEHQADMLLQDKGGEIVRGPYILVQALEYEGGGPSVPWKARQQDNHRLVYLDDFGKRVPARHPVVQAHLRHVRTLSHPNVLRIVDWGQADGYCFLVSDYAEGLTDLAQVLKKTGPLPVGQACDVIRQAALGLAHIHAKGMLQGSIKPHDLLLWPDGGTVQVRNTGVLCLQQPACEANEFLTFGQNADYVPPEALQASASDHRSDLYGLGCIFYHLLAGRVPFPAGTDFEKLRKHMQEQPEPVEQLRPDVPAKVADMVRKLMAKSPEDRFQAAADVAAALSK